MEVVEPVGLDGIHSKPSIDQIAAEHCSVLPTSDPPSSNFDASSADATTDGFEGGLVSEAHTDSSSLIGLNSPFSVSVSELADHEVLEMVPSGHFESSIEKDSGYDAEEGDIEHIELLCDSLLPDGEVVSPSKKRLANNDEFLALDTHIDKRPKLKESDSTNPSHALPDRNTHQIDAILPEIASSEPLVALSLPITPKHAVSASNGILPAKTPSRSRNPPQPHSTTTMVTRTRRMAAMSASGQEIIVPEHSHTIPKWLPRVPIRAIEIPVWTIRETYDEEETLREAYQSTKSIPLSSASTRLSDLENRFMGLMHSPSLPSDASNSATSSNKMDISENSTSAASLGAACADEDVGDEEYYAVLHYRYEIQERLRWISGPGSDRFKQEDRQMSVDQFRAHELWRSYTSATRAKLLPMEKWAQNMPQATTVRPKPIRKEKASDGSPSRSLSQSPTKQPTPTTIPKGFVLKIKSANGTAVIRTMSSAIPSFAHVPSIPSKATSSKPLASSKLSSTPQKPIVKKAGVFSAGAPSTVLPHFTVKKASPMPFSPPFMPSLPTSTPPKPSSTLIVKFGAKKFGTVGTASPAPLPSATPPQVGLLAVPTAQVHTGPVTQNGPKAPSSAPSPHV